MDSEVEGEELRGGVLGLWGHHGGAHASYHTVITAGRKEPGTSPPHHSVTFTSDGSGREWGYTPPEPGRGAGSKSLCLLLPYVETGAPPGSYLVGAP